MHQEIVVVKYEITDSCPKCQPDTTITEGMFVDCHRHLVPAGFVKCSSENELFVFLKAGIKGNDLPQIDNVDTATVNEYFSFCFNNRRIRVEKVTISHYYSTKRSRVEQLTTIYKGTVNSLIIYEVAKQDTITVKVCKYFYP
ncbi:MAG: hypothetical protein GXO48_01580 [Chlorobi bacterium]|nr:hypothetical protein [Chlorobiota bacterium]